MHVLGTSGHVDHGKSSLIAALTGTHPDRLKEEQEREMTIDLGFGWLRLPDGQEVGIVDVPGHVDFIENMLAGVGGIDAVLLVIAADEGIMPQTLEHLAILDLLQIQTGVVVLTKIDLVEDPDWITLVEMDIRSVLQGTTLQDADIVRVSSKTGEGMQNLVKKIDLLLRNSFPRPDLGRPRLSVDRIFSMPGFGSIVTGTLSDGQFTIGQEVELLPTGLRARIRGLQTHKKKEDIARPGSRTAINLAGLDLDRVRRGNVVTLPGQYIPTQRLDVRFRLLKSIKSPLKHHTQVKFFIGTSETIADIRLLKTDILSPGETGWFQLDLHEPVIAARGDKFILRRPSPGETLGGGTVVDPQPGKRHKRFDHAVINALENLARGTPAEVVLHACQAMGPALVKDVIIRTRLDNKIAWDALQELQDSGQVIILDDLLISTLHWESIKQTVFNILGEYHRENPLKRGMPREELKSRLKLESHLFNLIIGKLLENATLIEISQHPPFDQVKSHLVAMPTHSVVLSPSQKILVDRLRSLFTLSPYAPPSVKECKAQVGEDVYFSLLESSELVAVSPEVVFRKIDYDFMVGKVSQAIRQKGEISLAEVRDLFGTSRKYIQAFLEHMDAVGITVRTGETRRLK